MAQRVPRPSSGSASAAPTAPTRRSSTPISRAACAWSRRRDPASAGARAMRRAMRFCSRSTVRRSSRSSRCSSAETPDRLSAGSWRANRCADRPRCL
eukprot:3549836-Prymnesium_polylepis.1